jgi:hypothetical protein
MLANAVLSWCIMPSPAKQRTLPAVTVPLQKSKSYAALLAFLLPLDSAQAGQHNAPLSALHAAVGRLWLPSARVLLLQHLLAGQLPALEVVAWCGCSALAAVVGQPATGAAYCSEEILQ